MRSRQKLISSTAISSEQKDLAGLSDDDLMQLLRRDSETAFEQLIKKHYALVFGFATRFLGDRTVARELTQEVFLTLWHERYNYQPQDRFRSYLMTMLYHRCQGTARQHSYAANKLQLIAGESPLNVDVPSPLEKLLDAEQAAEVQALLLQLDEPTRAALTFRFSNGLSYKEISSITRQPEGTIKAQVCRGLKRLHRLWAKDQDT